MNKHHVKLIPVEGPRTITDDQVTMKLELDPPPCDWWIKVFNREVSEYSVDLGKAFGVEALLVTCDPLAVAATLEAVRDAGELADQLTGNTNDPAEFQWHEAVERLFPDLDD